MAVSVPPAQTSTQIPYPIWNRLFWYASLSCIFALEGKYIYGIAAPRLANAIAMNVSTESLTRGGVSLAGLNEGRDAIVVFGDFQCPFCRKLVADIEYETQSDTNVLWRNLPLQSIHERARGLAILSVILAKRNNLSEKKSELFKAGAASKYSDKDVERRVLAYAPSDLERNLASHDIDNDIRTARELKLSSTHSIFVVKSGSVFRVPNLVTANQVLNPSKNSNRGNNDK